MEQEGALRIAFMTSGGDAPGMNAAIRSIVRSTVQRGGQAFAVTEGMRGLVIGGNMISEMTWGDVCQITGVGGTIIKSSRCPEFHQRQSRKKAAFNLVTLGIDHLIVIGGDGSLTGASIFSREWPSLLAELCEEGLIQPDLRDNHKHLYLVGMAGSIDNDMIGTESTIGANTSLHRITEAVDCIHSTASSHQRAFVVEVMGRRCGWLALKAALCFGADWLFIPEDPPTQGQWESAMCETIQKHRQLGRTVSIVIVAEGAIDSKGIPIRSDHVCSLLSNSGLDARLTTLGHIQRGGIPSAYDRCLATLKGYRAVQAVVEMSQQSKSPIEKESSDSEKVQVFTGNPEKNPQLESDSFNQHKADHKYYSENPANFNALHQKQPLLVGINENKLTVKLLDECVRRTVEVRQAMECLDFARAFSLRDPDFRSDYAIWKLLRYGSEIPNPVLPNTQSSSYISSPLNNSLPVGETENSKERFIGILNCGAPAAGMNAAISAACYYAMCQGYRILGIHNGFEGLAAGDVRELTPSDIMCLIGRGGTILGTNRSIPDIAGKCLVNDVYDQIEKNNIDGLLIIGGFEAYKAALVLDSFMTSCTGNHHCKLNSDNPSVNDNNILGGLLDITSGKFSDLEHKDKPEIHQFDQNPQTSKTTRECGLKARKKIPIVVLPATVSNNVPGTDYSVGSDTALNAILSSCDAVRQSASSSRKRVFVIDVQGGYCGFLATLATLGAGASQSYIHEEKIHLSDLENDARRMREMFANDTRQGRIIIRNERASDTYSAEFVSRILEDEGAGSFDSRWLVLGHIQQGGSPSPLDRVRAVRLSVLSVMFIIDCFPDLGYNELSSQKYDFYNSLKSQMQSATTIDTADLSVTDLRSFAKLDELEAKVDLKITKFDKYTMELRPDDIKIDDTTFSDKTHQFSEGENSNLPSRVKTDDKIHQSSQKISIESQSMISEMSRMFIREDTRSLSNDTLQKFYDLEDAVRQPVSEFRGQNPNERTVVIGIRGPKVRFLSAQNLKSHTDFKYRRPLRQWWIGTVREVTRLLAQQGP